MAITHADASLQRRRSVAGSRLALFLVSLSVLCRLVAFVVCLAAEASRAESARHGMSTPGSDGGETDACEYGSGPRRARLAYAVCAFLLLVVAMFAEHAYMLVAVALPEQSSHASTLAPPPPSQPQDPPALFATTRTFPARAVFLYLATWICFAIAGVLLVVGICVESGGLSPRSKPNPICHVTRLGLFAAAGIFGLITALLGVCLYLHLVADAAAPPGRGERTLPSDKCGPQKGWHTTPRTSTSA